MGAQVFTRIFAIYNNITNYVQKNQWKIIYYMRKINTDRHKLRSYNANSCYATEDNDHTGVALAKYMRSS